MQNNNPTGSLSLRGGKRANHLKLPFLEPQVLNVQALNMSGRLDLVRIALSISIEGTHRSRSGFHGRLAHIVERSGPTGFSFPPRGLLPMVEILV